VLDEITGKTNTYITHDMLNNIINKNNSEVKEDHDFAHRKENELTIFIGSWNMAGVNMNPNEKFFDWLFPIKDMKEPDIYVIGFQEIVELVMSNILFNSNSHIVDNYRNLITKNLNKIGE
jgi:hypothetical protein